MYTHSAADLTLDLWYSSRDPIEYTKFYNRQEIKDAVAYLRIVQNTSDDISFERIVNVPKRGIGATTLNQIKIKSREIRGSYFEATLELVSSNDLKPNVKIALLDFTEIM